MYDIPEANGAKFVLDMDAESLAVHCSAHPQCRLNRSVRRGKRDCQGRPVGFLIAWMRAAERFPDQKSHLAFSRRAARGDEALSFERRQQDREWARQQPTLAGVFEFEKHGARPGERGAALAEIGSEIEEPFQFAWG